MPNIDDGDEEIELDVDDLFRDPEDEEPEDNPTEGSEGSEDLKPDTKAVSQRINEVRSKTEHDTQERIAKELGYESYAAMKQAKQKKLLADAGLDDEEVNGVVNKLVEQRLADDPRLKKLQEYEERDKAAFVKKQLSEVNKISGQNYTSLDQLPPDVIELWQKTGNLKQAYLATKGEELLTGKSNKVERGSLDHLASGGSAGGSTKTRKLTEEEKAIWRNVDPDITEEELEKKTTAI